uniref:Uncharacterized protein n=1 Tax=Romanomermis culicivorax TaxID=13658 RepID=A0A915L7E2_ROMCU
MDATARDTGNSNTIRKDNQRLLPSLKTTRKCVVGLQMKNRFSLTAFVYNRLLANKNRGTCK